MSDEVERDPFSNFRDFFTKYEELTVQVKKKFEAIIVDKEIPLNQRWQFFIDAPSALKNQEAWIQHFKVLDRLEKNISWYDEFNTDKYQTVYMADIIHSTEDNIAYYVEHPKVKPYGKLAKHFLDDPSIIDEWKEEILSRNLDSFVYDW